MLATVVICRGQLGTVHRRSALGGIEEQSEEQVRKPYGSMPMCPLVGARATVLLPWKRT